jgi:hypothetical protein
MCDVWLQHVFILDIDLVPDPGFYATLMRDYGRQVSMLMKTAKHI